MKNSEVKKSFRHFLFQSLVFISILSRITENRVQKNFITVQFSKNIFFILDPLDSIHENQMVSCMESYGKKVNLDPSSISTT